MKKSIWMDFQLPSYPKLETDLVCDICIVGGGITGISLAYYLKDIEKNIVLIEQNRLARSTTGLTTAKLTYLQQDILSKIYKARGYSYARKYYQAQRDSLNEVIKIIKKENIFCHLEKSPSHLFVQEKKNIPKLKQEFQIYKKMGAPIELHDKLPLDCHEKLCCSVSDTYVFHPLEYINGLLASIGKTSLSIYENTRMINFNKENGIYKIYLKNGHIIQAKELVFAGCYPPMLIPGFFPIRTYLEKDFVECYKVDAKYQFSAINLDKDLLSIRFFEDFCIKTKHSFILGKSAITKKNLLAQTSVQYAWSNYDLVTADSLPIIGYIGNGKNGFYIASGFQTWGMTNSNLSARIIRDLLLEEKKQYFNIFNPNRTPSFVSLIYGLRNLFLNIYHFIESYIPLFQKEKIILENGKRIGVVRDLYGKVHRVQLTCPHMNCGLVYNRKERTWDCPCHGSRFSVDGELLRGPATDCVSQDTLFQ